MRCSQPMPSARRRLPTGATSFAHTESGQAVLAPRCGDRFSVSLSLNSTGLEYELDRHIIQLDSKEGQALQPALLLEAMDRSLEDACLALCLVDLLELLRRQMDGTFSCAIRLSAVSIRRLAV